MLHYKADPCSSIGCRFRCRILHLFNTALQFFSVIQIDGCPFAFPALCLAFRSVKQLGFIVCFLLHKAVLNTCRAQLFLSRPSNGTLIQNNKKGMRLCALAIYTGVSPNTCQGMVLKGNNSHANQYAEDVRTPICIQIKRRASALSSLTNFGDISV